MAAAARMLRRERHRRRERSPEGLRQAWHRAPPAGNRPSRWPVPACRAAPGAPCPRAPSCPFASVPRPWRRRSAAPRWAVRLCASISRTRSLMAASINPRRCDRSAAISIPKAHRFAVQVGLVRGGRLDGVAEGMSEVQDGPQVMFAFVPGDHGRLDLAGSADGVGQRIGVSARAAWPCCGPASRTAADPTRSRT